MKKITLVCLSVLLTLGVFAQLSKTVDCTAGNLTNLLTSSEKSTVTDLTLTGTIDARDFTILRDNLTILASLDLSQVTIATFTGKGGPAEIGSAIVTYSANTIPAFAFLNPNNFKGKTSLKNIVLPNSITTIDTYAFQNASSLVSVTIPNTVTTIGDYAFSSCSNLTTLAFPVSVTTIGQYAYSDCSGLTTIVIPASVTKINTGAFSSCPALTSVTMLSALPASITMNNSIFSYNTPVFCFLHVPAFTFNDYSKYSISSSFNSIYDDIPAKTVTTQTAGTLSSYFTALELTHTTDLTVSGPIDARDIKLMRDNLPNVVRINLTDAFITQYTGTGGTAGTSSVSYAANTLPQYSFYNPVTATSKTSIKYIVYPKTATAIGDYAFQSCTGLTSHIIPAQITSIGQYAFNSCSGLLSLTIPQNISQLGSSAFANCTGLTSLFVNRSNPLDISSVVTIFNNVNQGSCILHVPYSTKKNYQIAAQWKNFTNICEPTITAGGLAAAIPQAVRDTLTSLVITNTIDARDFKTMRDSMPMLQKIDMKNASIVAYTGSFGTAGNTEITYPKNTIPVNAFYNSASGTGKTGLISVICPSLLSSFGDYAFNGCSGLLSFTILTATYVDISLVPNLLTGIDKSSCVLHVPASLLINYKGSTQWKVFSNIIGDTFNKILNINASGTLNKLIPISERNLITNLTLNGYINAQDFKTLRDSMPVLSVLNLFNTTINNYTGTNGTKGTNSITYTNGYIPAYAFCNPTTLKGDSTLTSIILPSITPNIETFAFANCTNLSLITFDNYLQAIGDNAFQNCVNLEKIDLSSTLTSIGASAFLNCSRLQNIIIPPSAKTINNYAFKGCNGATNVYAYYDPRLYLNGINEVFTGIDKTNCILHVPVGTKKNYASLLQWGDFKNIIDDANAKTVTVTIPGTLATYFNESEMKFVTNLKILGTIDARDFKTMRDNFLLLANLDISNATIVAYTGSAGPCNSNLTYPSNAVPQYAFGYAGNETSGKATLQTITLPSTLSAIGVYAFAGCKVFSSINLPLTMTKIDIGTFCNCPLLKSIVIPSSITSLEFYSFANSGIQTITILSSVKTIASEVFYYCTGLTSITVKAVYPVDLTKANYVFANVSKSIPLNVPYGTSTLYKNAYGWKDFYYIYELSPTTTLTSFTPQSARKGDLVTIKGTNLAGTSSVSFGGIAASNFSILNDSTITATVAEGSTGKITVITDGIYTVSGFTYVPDLTITSGETIISTNTTVNNLIISPNAKLTIKPGITLTVMGNLTLQSDATGTATLVDEGGVVSVLGITTVQQYVTGSINSSTGYPNGRFWYMASPLASANSSVFNSAAKDNKLWRWSEPKQSYTEITDNTSTLNPFEGFAVRMGADTTLNFTGGILNNGDLSLPISHNGTGVSEGYVLAGNPYPSYIDWEQIYAASTNVSSTMWYRTINSSNAMVYDTYNAELHVGTNNNGNGVVTKYIPPMQAFWASAPVGGGILQATNAMRSHQTSNKLKADEESKNQLLRLVISNGGNSDEQVLVFNPNAENTFDKFDSPKMFATDASIPQIYTQVENKKLTINGLKTIDSNIVIPIYFSTKKMGSFTISSNEIIGLDKYQLTLEDLKLHKKQDLGINQTYTFTSDSVSDENRFVIRLKAGAEMTGIEETKLTKINIYTVSEGVVVEVNGIINSQSKAIIYNVLGQAIATTDIVSNKTIIRGNFIAGCYYVKVQSGNAIKTQQVFIK